MVEFVYHWSPEYPRRKVHLSVSDDAMVALCGRYVGNIEVDDIGSLRPLLIQSAASCAVLILRPICIQCYKRALAMVESDG